MALTFFWRCEGTTLDGTNDYSAGDTTASLINSGSISATAARIGTNGLLRPASFAGGAQFAPASIYPGNVGSMAFSLYSVGSVTNTSGISIQRFLGTDTGNYLDVQYAGGGSTSATNLRVRMIRSGGSGRIIAMTGNQFTPDAWFGVVARWDVPNDLLRIELYNETGTLLDSAENDATDLSVCEPVEVGSQFMCGAGRSSDAWATYTDNVFVANTYAEPLQNNLTIAAYGDYSATTKYLKLLTEAAAAGDTAVQGVVMNGSNFIGTFSGQSFEADLESGEAVLLIPADDVTPSGDTLTTSDTPLVFAYNATDATRGPGTATVIEV